MGAAERLEQIGRQLCVRIETEAGKALGSGFYLGAGYAVTAKHVLLDHQLLSTPTTARVRFFTETLHPMKKSYSVLVVESSTELDVAILKISTDTQINQVARIDTEFCSGDEVMSVCISVARKDGDIFIATIEGRTLEDNRVQIKLKDAQVIPGMSGSMLFNMRTRRIVGMLTKTRSRRMNLGGYGIPINQIIEVLSEEVTDKWKRASEASPNDYPPAKTDEKPSQENEDESPINELEKMINEGRFADVFKVLKGRISMKNSYQYNRLNQEYTAGLKGIDLIEFSERLKVFLHAKL